MTSLSGSDTESASSGSVSPSVSASDSNRTGFSSFSRAEIARQRRHAKKEANKKLAIRLGISLLIFIIVWSVYLYQESLFGPYTTLGVPNKALQPGSVKMAGLTTSHDPFHPLYTADKKKVQELIKHLQKAEPLSAAQQALFEGTHSEQTLSDQTQELSEVLLTDKAQALTEASHSDKTQALSEALLSDSDQVFPLAENPVIYYFTLHREAGRGYETEDFALRYYPDAGIVYFNRQYFKINTATVAAFSKIIEGMTPGWW